MNADIQILESLQNVIAYFFFSLMRHSQCVCVSVCVCVCGGGGGGG